MKKAAKEVEKERMKKRVNSKIKTKTNIKKETTIKREKVRRTSNFNEANEKDGKTRSKRTPLKRS